MPPSDLKDRTDNTEDEERGTGSGSVEDLDAAYNAPSATEGDRAANQTHHKKVARPSWKTDMGARDLNKIYDSPGISDEDRAANQPNDKRNKSESVEDLDSAEKEAKKDAPDAEADKKEQAEVENKIGGGYKDTAKQKASSKMVNLLATRQKKIIGGTVVATIVGLIIGLISSILPLKIANMVNNLQDKFFSVTQSDVSIRTEELFNEYLRKKVFTGMAGAETCKSTKTITLNCVAEIKDDSFGGRAFRGWRNARLENTLATKYGIEFERRVDGHVYMKAPGLGQDLNMADFESGRVSSITDFEQVNRTQIKSKFRQALQDETLYKRALYRVRVAGLLKKKYGTKLCIFACKIGDKTEELHSWVDQKINGKEVQAFDLVINRNVLGKRTETLAIAMSCVIDNACNNDPTYSSDPNDFERKDALQNQVQDALAKRGIRLEQEALAKTVEQVSKISEAGGFTKYLVIELAEKIGIKAFAEKALPVIGWINFAAQMIDKAATLGPKLQRWGYTLAQVSAVSTYLTYATYADEMKSGNTLEPLAGSMTAALGESTGDATHRGQPAEASPVYQSIVNPTSTPKTALLNVLAPQKVLAEAQQKPTFTCDDGSTPAVGELVCPEEKLTQGIGPADAISSAVNQPPLNAVKEVASIWNAGPGAVINFAGNVVGQLTSFVIDHTPGLKQAQEKFSEWAGTFLNFIGEKVFPSAVSSTMSGARLLNVMAAGADSAANEYAHYGLGGALLTDAQVSELRQDQEAQEQQEFARRPIYARMFATDTSKSLVSKLAMSVPTNKSVGIQNMASGLFSNPFAKLTDGFGTLFTSKQSFAAVSTKDPFGVPQYGYAKTDPVLKADSSIYTEAYCNDQAAKWKAAVQYNNVTGLDYHTTTNPCLLEKATTAASAALFTDEVLQP